jgi:hypothetical protein
MRKKRKIPVVKTMVGLFMCFVLGLILMPGSETVSKEASTYQAEQQKTEQSEQEKVKIQEEPPMESKRFRSQGSTGVLMLPHCVQQ